MSHVFLCYSRQDEQFVLELARNLKDRDVPVWVDQWEIPPGADWDQSIDRALYACDRFLIVLSPASVDSREVRGELRTALDESKPIIPVVYQPCQIPRQLRVLQIIDLSKLTATDPSAIAQVVRALKPLSSTDSVRTAATIEPVLAAPEATKWITLLLAGHTGHGKSTLVSALIRFQADRGLETPGELVDNRVDLPSPIVRRALPIGETSFDLLDAPAVPGSLDDLVEIRYVGGLLLVVSAADGPMPLTREHVALAQSRRLPIAAVYLSKMDLAESDPEMVDLVEIEVRELLKSCGFPGDDIPILRGSALRFLQGGPAASADAEGIVRLIRALGA